MAGIVLASGSAIRRKLLEAAGVSFRATPSSVDESALLDDDDAPRSLAARLAKAKAIDVARRESDAFVIGADQTLELDRRLMVKADSLDRARANLAAMSGRSHRLHSAFSVVLAGREVARATRSARLTMRPLSRDAIDRYLAEAGEGILSSVGCYHLEGLGVRLFERIEGDYFTILGLPMLPLLKALRRLEAVES